MDAKIASFFESVGSFFGGGDHIPWCDRDIIANDVVACPIDGGEQQPPLFLTLERPNWFGLRAFPHYVGCEKEVAEGAVENKNESLMRLSWALVHSRQPEDVNRGIAMLEASLDNSSSPLQLREKLYLLAVGHYRSGDYPRSRQILERCLEIAPDWRQALTLKKVVEDQIAKDGAIGIGIAATAVGLLVGGIVAAVTRKR